MLAAIQETASIRRGSSTAGIRGIAKLSWGGNKKMNGFNFLQHEKRFHAVALGGRLEHQNTSASDRQFSLFLSRFPALPSVLQASPASEGVGLPALLSRCAPLPSR